MFGEKEIIGQTIVKVDSKKRITLPKFTYAESYNELYVLDMENYIALHTFESLEVRFAKIYEKYKDSDKQTKKRLKQIKKILYSRIKDNIKCDNNRRISLSSVAEENQEFICIGCKDHVKLKIK